VHPGAYKAFESWGREPILRLARARHPITKVERDLDEPDDELVVDVVKAVIRSHGASSSWRLVDLTHATDGPWHFVVNNPRTPSGFGLRISDEVTRARFGRLKLAINDETRVGEPDDDTPLA
jgi:uncharacterized phage-associated protein